MKSLYALAFSLALPAMAHAASFDLTLTANWTAADYNVASTGPAGATDPEVDDDAVFGIAPSDGSLSVTLRVDTASEVFYDAAATSSSHDFYGYSDVSLVGGSLVYGSATFSESDILTGLIGPDGFTAALWTDTSLASGAPGLVSFRVIADWLDAQADIFFGTRSAIVSGDSVTINDNFFLSEYFGGEAIGVTSSAYTTSVAPAPAVPLPAGGVLLLSGAAGLLGLRRLRRR